MLFEVLGKGRSFTEYSYEVIRSRRRSVSLQIKDDLSVVVRAPFFINDSRIAEIVRSKSDWIDLNISRIKRRSEAEKEFFSLYSDSGSLKKTAAEDLGRRLEYYSSLMGLQYKSFRITSAVRRFGSCSADNRICLSFRLLMYPEAARDYVVVHELAHIKHKNHGSSFYALISEYMPDYKQRRALLRMI